MVNLYNPFTPHSPVYTGMFAGRTKEIDSIDKAFFQAKKGNPNHILLIGERGIGKTSLLSLAKSFSEGELDLDGDRYDFLTVQVNLANNMNLVNLAVVINASIEREISKINPEITGLKKIWDFVTRFSVAGISYSKNREIIDDTEIVDKFTYSIIDTIKALTGNDLGLTKKKDGLVLLIDEADKASSDLNLGTFLKNLTEKLNIEGCNNFLVILSGLPNLRDVLRTSHESSLRLFKEHYLEPLSKNEVTDVINRGIKESNKNSESKISIDREATDLIYTYSEGYPHFVQQIGYSAFEVNSDAKIDEEDIKQGYFMKNGALEQIGDRYYRKFYYDDIHVDSQRKILDIMAEEWNRWVTRETIKSKFKGKDTTLDNCLRALKDKNIILSKKGVKGQYRLQWLSFAFWIRSHNKKAS